MCYLPVCAVHLTHNRDGSKGQVLACVEHSAHVVGTCEPECRFCVWAPHATEFLWTDSVDQWIIKDGGRNERFAKKWHRDVSLSGVPEAGGSFRSSKNYSVLVQHSV